MVKTAKLAKPRNNLKSLTKKAMTLLYYTLDRRKVLYSVAQSCPSLWNPMDCSQTGSSVRGISQARTLGWVDISYSRRSFWPRVQTHVSCISCIGRWVLYPWATWEAWKCIKKLIFTIIPYANVHCLKTALIKSPLLFPISVQH